MSVFPDGTSPSGFFFAPCSFNKLRHFVNPCKFSSLRSGQMWPCGPRFLAALEARHPSQFSWRPSATVSSRSPPSSDLGQRGWCEVNGGPLGPRSPGPPYPGTRPAQKPTAKPTVSIEAAGNSKIATTINPLIMYFRLCLNLSLINRNKSR